MRIIPYEVLKEFTIEEADRLEHGQPVEFPHNTTLVVSRTPEYIEHILEEECSGDVVWDAGIEGFICMKCDLYTGVK